MYLIGFNTVKFPFFIPKDFPRDALKKQDREKFLNFVDEQNETLKWTFAERLQVRLVKILYPPLAKYVQLSLRRKKFNRLKSDIFMLFPPQFWTDKGQNKSLRLACSKDF